MSCPLLSTVALTQPQAGIEFACLSLWIEPQAGRFEAAAGEPWEQDIIGRTLGDPAALPRRTLLTTLLTHPYNTRANCLQQAAQLASHLPIQAQIPPKESDWTPTCPCWLRQRLGLEPTWMLSPFQAIPNPQGRPLLSRYQRWQSNSQVDLLLGCRGRFRACSQPSKLTRQRELLQQALAPHLEILHLQYQGSPNLSQALQLAQWQIAQLDPF